MRSTPELPVQKKVVKSAFAVRTLGLTNKHNLHQEGVPSPLTRLRGITTLSVTPHAITGDVLYSRRSPDRDFKSVNLSSETVSDTPTCSAPLRISPVPLRPGYFRWITASLSLRDSKKRAH